MFVAYAATFLQGMSDRRGCMFNYRNSNQVDAG